MKSALIIFGLLVLLALALRFGLGEQDRGWSTTQPAVLLSHDEAAGQIDDERWLLADATVVDGYEGSFWLRTFVEFRESSFRHIRIDGTASFDLWWDGEFLGRNGRLDADGSEVEIGRMDSLFLLPEGLAGQGWHSLVLRANRDALPGRPLSGGVSFLKGSDYPFNLMSQVVMAILTAVFALGSGGVYLILSFRHPSRAQAIYIAFCAAFFFLALAEAWRHVFGYTYPWQPIRLQVIAGLTALTGVLLNAVLFVYFGYRRLIWLAAAMMLVLGVSYTLLMRQPDTFGVLAAAFCVGLATVTCSIATYQARPGAPLLLSCLAGGLALNLLNISYVDEWGVFAVFLLFATAVNFSLARDIRQIAQSFAEAQLRSLRLRQELYRRFIQPHFMLNTLTTISEWIAIAPDQAEEAVGELAGEVRVLGRMIDRDLVPVSEEINLCELHCKVMSRRLRTEFRLEMHGEFGGTLPPAVLHTLVENVFAHNRYSTPHVVLRLECTQSAGRRILRLIAPRGDAAHSPTADGPGGLQYVRARLAEAYVENWQLEVCDEAGDWIAELHTPAEAR